MAAAAAAVSPVVPGGSEWCSAAEEGQGSAETTIRVGWAVPSIGICCWAGWLCRIQAHISQLLVLHRQKKRDVMPKFNLLNHWSI
jgi:hypothetical protein